MKIPISNPLRGDRAYVSLTEAISHVECGRAEFSPVDGKFRWKQRMTEPAVRRRMTSAEISKTTERGYDLDVVRGKIVDLRFFNKSRLPFAGDRMNMAKIQSARETNSRLRQREAERRLLGI